MLRTHLANIFRAALQSLVEQGRLPREVLDVRIEIADPKNPEHGDFACNIAMVASKVAGKNPREFAEMLVAALSPSPFRGAKEGGVGERDSIAEASESSFSSPLVFDKIEIAGPGFINLTLNSEFVASYVSLINALGQNELAKQSPVGIPLKINVEFVSVNPNGPITIGSGRGAAYGSTLCNIFEAAGHTVHREYYINDGVNSEQMRLFAESVRALIKGEQVPENGYKGDYVQDLADQFLRDLRDPGSIGQLESDVRHLIFRLKAGGDDFEWNTSDLPSLVAHSASSLETEHVFESALALINTAKLERSKGRSILVAWIDALDVTELQQLFGVAMVAVQRHALEMFGYEYDTWFSEAGLHISGTVAAEIDSLAAKGIANTDPTRTKLKLAKGGKIEDVIIESQTADVDEEGEAPEVPSPISNGRGDLGVRADSLSATEAPDSEAVPSPPSPLSHQIDGRGGDGETLWLRSTKLGDDMDRVLLRKDGRLTYIASDVAYHKDKFNRPAGADKLITILGPDHHGYIGRLTAVVAAMLLEPSEPGEPCGDELDAKLYRDENERAACQTALKEARQKLEVQIYQLVRFVKDGKPAPMRKRDGNIYALIDLMREIGTKLKPEGTEAEQLESGKDVARFFYLMRSHDTTFDFDLDLAEKQSDENPVFYVQYAYARICSILEKAEVTPSNGGVLSLLTHPKEKMLIKRIADLPNEVSRAAEDYGVHRLTTYAIELARAFHGFYGDCKVNDPLNPDLSAARVQVCKATQKALKETLDLLGVSAPVSM